MTWSLSVPSGPASEFSSRAKDALSAARDAAATDDHAHITVHFDSGTPDAAVKALTTLVNVLRKESDAPTSEAHASASATGWTNGDNESVSLSVSFTSGASADSAASPVGSAENQ